MSRDVEQLFINYKPLILSTYKKFHPMFNSRADKEDLMSSIKTIFTQLVFEYNPKRGVDFPYYIKRMLQLRTGHYVTQALNRKTREIVTEGLTNDSVTFFDVTDQTGSIEQMEKLLDVMSWNDDFTLGKKQKKLFIDLLTTHKSLKEIAAEEGVDVTVIHTRMHFLLKKINAHREEVEEFERIGLPLFPEDDDE